MEYAFSQTISGAALNGFANAAEGLQGEGDLIDQLVAASNGLLDEGNEAFSDLFELLNGFFNGSGDLQSLFAGLEELGIVDPGLLDGLHGHSDGAVVQQQSVSISIQLEFSFSSETIVVQQSDPLTLDLDDDGIELTSYQKGARFDISATGRSVTTAFVTGGDAFLALDRNGNGRIDNGAELFGDQRGASNGFEALQVLDENGDGLIDGNDSAFDELLLFRDNGNGVTEKDELFDLASAGIRALELAYENTNIAAQGGNRISQLAAYHRLDGSHGTLADAVLNFVV
jgi:hypothetical protein